MENKDPNIQMAMQQKDIDFLKDISREMKLSLTAIDQKLDIYNTTFVKKEDLRESESRLQKAIDQKVEISVFVPVKDTLTWVGRLIIGEIVAITGVGIISLVSHFVK